MAKIIVFEDDMLDLRKRYEYFLEEHTVDVSWQGTKDQYDLFMNLWERQQNIPSFTFIEPINLASLVADFYCSDGLDGRYNQILQYFPIEKCYVQSDNPQIEQDAKVKGFHIGYPPL